MELASLLGRGRILIVLLNLISSFSADHLHFHVLSSGYQRRHQCLDEANERKNEGLLSIQLCLNRTTGRSFSICSKVRKERMRHSMVEQALTLFLKEGEETHSKEKMRT